MTEFEAERRSANVHEPAGTGGESARRLVQETEVVAEVGRIISSSLDINDVYDRFADELRKVIPFDRVSLNIVDLESGTFSVPYSEGIDVPDRRPGDVIPLATSVTEEVSRTRLALLFHNLISHGIKFRRGHTPRLHISADRHGDKWAISVRDSGIGVAPEHQVRIFRMFNRLHGRSEYSGTGIGLALGSKIVERHEGKIRVESEVAEGSTFCFTSPTLDSAVTLHGMPALAFNPVIDQIILRLRNVMGPIWLPTSSNGVKDIADTQAVAGIASGFGVGWHGSQVGGALWLLS